MQKGICYDNEVFIPPDKQPAEQLTAAANAPGRMSQQAAPTDEELLADMHCLDQGGEHVDILLEERMCLPRLNTLKRPHASSQQIRRVEQHETRRNLTSSSRTASATVSEGDAAGEHAIWSSLRTEHDTAELSLLDCIGPETSGQTAACWELGLPFSLIA